MTTNQENLEYQMRKYIKLLELENKQIKSELSNYRVMHAYNKMINDIDVPDIDGEIGNLADALVAKQIDIYFTSSYYKTDYHEEGDMPPTFEDYLREIIEKRYPAYSNEEQEGLFKMLRDHYWDEVMRRAVKKPNKKAMEGILTSIGNKIIQSVKINFERLQSDEYKNRKKVQDDGQDISSADLCCPHRD